MMRLGLIVFVFLLCFGIPSAQAEVFEYSAESCEFGLYFPQKPKISNVKLNRETRTKMATISQSISDSAVSIRALCYGTDPAHLATQMDEEGMIKILEQDAKNLQLQKHKVEFKTVEHTRWGILTGYRYLDENTPKYFFKYLLVGRTSVMTVEAAYVGRHPTLDDLFNATLRTLHVKPY